MVPLLLLIMGAFSGGMFSACGRPPGVANNFAGPERPGIASAVQPFTPKEQEIQKLQEELSALNTQLNQKEEESQKWMIQGDKLRGQISASQAQLESLQSGAQEDLSRKSLEYSAADLQAQRQQIELDVVSAQVQQEIQTQRSQLAETQGLVEQERAWGFDSPELDVNTMKLAAERARLAQLESQYWGIQQQAGQIATMQSSSQRWIEGSDQQQTLQNNQRRIEEQTQQLQSLQTQYAQAQQKQEQARSDAAAADSAFRITRDQLQALQGY